MVSGAAGSAEGAGTADGIQTRIAPGPRLSHWKYGNAVTVTCVLLHVGLQRFYIRGLVSGVVKG